jgi:hypothetical protein
VPANWIFYLSLQVLVPSTLIDVDGA